MTEQPSGTVTLLFSDIEGSTRLLEELGPEAYRAALAEHRGAMREAFARHGGYEVDYEGDAFFVAFPTADGGVAAAEAAQAALAGGPIRVRIGVHTGEPLLDPPKYVGIDVHRAARIMSAAHGGQVLLSPTTVSLLAADTFRLRDLGEHRLKDLSAPVRLHQLMVDGQPAELPPLKTLHRSNLPVPATPFVGRERELGELGAMLAEGVRLLSLLGPGGSGKTRLALQAAAEAADEFPGGLFWVALAPLRDSSLLERTVALALEVRDEPGRELLDVIADAVRGTRAILLVDNCEHLIDAVARLVANLLERCPELVVATTSRERLSLRGERTYAVAPLELADAEALFAERARAIRGDVEPDHHVTAICEAVDRLPLAVELAAARVRSLSTQTIRERLGERLSLLATRDRDADERHRTLRATIGWSYDLLDEEEQTALRALSVFVGGCTLDAAEQVTGADLDLLESLLDKSLLRHRVDEAGHDRYWMLETIREYAGEQLERAAEATSAHDAHRRFFVDKARGLAPAETPLRGHEFGEYAADRSNFRVVVLDALRNRDADTALALAAGLGRVWIDAGGEYTDSIALIEEALSLQGGGDGDRGYASAWAAMGLQVLHLDERTDRRLVEAEAIAGAIGDVTLRLTATRTRAVTLARRDQFAEALAQLRLATEGAREHGLVDFELQTAGYRIQVMRFAAYADGPPDLSLLEECLSLGAEISGRVEASGSALERGVLAYDLAYAHLGLGHAKEAFDQARIALESEIALGRTLRLNLLLSGLVAGLLLEQVEAGVALTSCALRLCSETGAVLDLDDQYLLAQLEDAARTNLGDAPYAAAAERGRAMDVPDAVELARSLRPPDEN